MKYWMAIGLALYTGLAALANPAVAGEDWSAIEALREGDMKKLIFVAEPSVVPETEFLGDGEAPTRLSDFAGQWLVVNFWATWCAPCRAEMPTLAAMQDSFEGRPARVLTIATGRNSPQGITRFFEETGIDNLPEYRDPKQALARDMGVFGLPITVIVDPAGREIARLRGDAHWDSDSAAAIMGALIAGY